MQNNDAPSLKAEHGYTVTHAALGTKRFLACDPISLKAYCLNLAQKRDRGATWNEVKVQRDASLDTYATTYARRIEGGEEFIELPALREVRGWLSESDPEPISWWPIIMMGALLIGMAVAGGLGCLK